MKRTLSREEIICMARESGIPLAWVSGMGAIQWSQLERFANAAYAAGAAAEREQCAKVCEWFGKTLEVDIGENFAEEIRARGQK